MHRHLSCVLGMALVARALFAVDIDQKASFLPNDDIDVLRYDVGLTVPKMELVDFTVDERITLRAVHAITSLKLHADKSKIQVGEARRGSTPLRFAFIGDSVLRIDLDKNLPPGETASFQILYTIANHDDGTGFKLTRQGDARIWNAVNWPTGARAWLPSNDSPEDPAQFGFEVHVPNGMAAGANGRLKQGDLSSGSGLDANGLRVFQWEQEIAMPTYDINIVIGDFTAHQKRFCFDTAGLQDNLIDCGQAPVKLDFLFLDPKAGSFPDALFEQSRAAIFFSSLLGPYPYAKLGFVDAPHPFDMESPSLITLPGGGGPVAHELAHQWWGNSVGIKHWGDIWISEGFATYFDALYREFRSGQAPPYSEQPDSCRLNLPADTGPRRDCVYIKGAAALHDLRRRIGKLAGSDEAGKTIFYALSRKLYRTFRFSRLGTTELLAFLSANLTTTAAETGHALTDGSSRQLVDDWHRTWLEADR